MKKVSLFVHSNGIEGSWLDCHLNRVLKESMSYLASKTSANVDLLKLGIVDQDKHDEDDEDDDYNECVTTDAPPVPESNIGKVLHKILVSVAGENNLYYEREAHTNLGKNYNLLGVFTEGDTVPATPKAVVVVQRHGALFRATVWATKSKIAHNILNAFDKQLPNLVYEPVEVDEAMIDITFWRMSRGANGQVKESEKTVMCPSLDEVRGNYPQVEKSISKLFEMDDPTEHGKIVLWHGPPGMGKTYAIRALARDWCNRLGASVEIVMDPENLFGNADYMHDLILSEDYDGDTLRLIIVEDSEEFLDRTVKETRQGFARLLNLTDGILGQGTKVVFLLTANAKFDKIDPAIVRPGRCLQELEFTQFNRTQAAHWWWAETTQGKAKVKVPLVNGWPENTTLAKLYELKKELGASVVPELVLVTEAEPVGSVVGN